MKCPICKSLVKEESFLPGGIHCRICDLVFLKFTLKPKYGLQYFEQSTRPSLLAKVASPVLRYFYKERVAKIRNILKGQKKRLVLDYGCGSGKLVRELNNAGIKTFGFEPSVGARNLAAKEKLPIYGSLKSIKIKFDLVTFWHSLEHTKNPREVINNVKKLLKKNGKLLIAVPNADSFEARIAKDKWFHYSKYFHPMYFSPVSLKYLLNKEQFNISEIDYLNLEYTVSGLLQTFLNLILPRDILYSVVSHRRFTLSRREAIYYSVVSILLSILLSPLLIISFIIQLVFKKTGAIIVIT